MAIATYNVTGMTCGHCERHVTEGVSAIEGVTGVEVSHETGVLSITSDRDLSDDEVIAAVDEAGYEAVRA